MDRVYELVGALSNPQVSAQEKQLAQAEFQSLQKSTDSLDVANALLGSADANAQFLGALTYTVKVNEGVTSESAEVLRNALLEWVRIGTSRNYSAFVIRKILATIANLFLRTPGDNWSPFITTVVQLVGPEMGCEFLTMLIEDSQVLKSSLRPAIEPLLGLLVSLIGPNEKSLNMYRVWATSFFDVLEPQLSQVIPLLQNEEVSEEAASVLRDLIELHGSSWSKEHKLLLVEVLRRVLSSVGTDADSHEELARLVLRLSLENLDQNTEFHRWIAEVLTNPAIPVVEDPLASEVLEFWTEFVEEAPEQFKAEGLLDEIVARYWERVKLYPNVEKQWVEFSSFRVYFHDFLEVVYPLVGSPLIEHLAGVVLTNLASQNWIEIECALDCLTGLQDTVHKNPELIGTLVQNSQLLWSELSSCPSIRVRRTAALSIGVFTKSFDTNVTAMAAALNYLFTCLAEPTLQVAASRGIADLCDACYESLAGEASTFIDAYKGLRAAMSREQVAQARVVKAVAKVIDAIPDSSQRASELGRFIDLILDGELTLDMLALLEAVGEGLQGPYDRLQGQPANMDTVRGKILAVAQKAIQSPDSDVCTSLCKIFKHGLLETPKDAQYNPYSFAPDQVIDFVLSKFRMGPADCRPPVVDLAARVVSSANADKVPLNPALVQRLLVDIVSTPEAAQDACTNTLGLLSDLTATLQSQVPEKIIEDLAIPSLLSSDRFVIRAASSFWVNYAPYVTAEQGQKVVRVLMTQFSGQASRSDLDHFVDILQTLTRKHPRAVGRWLQQEVVDAPASPNLAKQDIRVRSEFVAQLQLVRGSGQTKQIATKFWLKARGLPEKY